MLGVRDLQEVIGFDGDRRTLGAQLGTAGRAVVSWGQAGVAAVLLLTVVFGV